MATNDKPNPIVSWSSGTSTSSPSTRFATEEPDLKQYVVNPASVQPPPAGLGFFKRFSFTPDKLSTRSRLAPAEWSATR